MNRRVIFACFATAILLATLREWSAPLACPRVNILTPELLAGAR